MKKQVVCTLTVALAVTSLSALAANPFVDVPSDSWAYKSVVELADAGIIQGVDGQYFQGNRNITRYEAAEMVAKAMAHMDKASVEQRALINKLADEYADELNNLGVRVTNLENRVGNTRVFGDAFVLLVTRTATRRTTIPGIRASASVPRARSMTALKSQPVSARAFAPSPATALRLTKATTPMSTWPK